MHTSYIVESLKLLSTLIPFILDKKVKIATSKTLLKLLLRELTSHGLYCTSVIVTILYASDDFHSKLQF